MRTSNPTLSDKVFSSERATTSGDVMTMEGAVNKSIWSILLCMAAGYWTFTHPEMATMMMPLYLVGIALFFVLYFKRSWAPTIVPVYAIVEGCVLGSISVLADMAVSAQLGLAPGETSGIVPKAIGLTFGTLLCMLVGYKSGYLRLSDKMKTVLFAATGAIMLTYLVDIVLHFMGTGVPFIHSNGPIGIGFSLVVIAIASFNLLFDFEFIESAANSRSAPKYMEWFAAFGLLVTLVWLYIEMLRLLMKLQSRD